MKFNFFIYLISILFTVEGMNAQDIERERPSEWKKLVQGGAFKDRFLPMPKGQQSKNVWGTKAVSKRYVDNGIENSDTSFWGGNILKEKEDLYHLYVCGWPESSPKGHMFWPKSEIYHAVSTNSIGPFNIVEKVGFGHNPEAYQLADGRVVVYCITGYYIADNFNGPWQHNEFTFDLRDRYIIEGLSNLTFAKREDQSVLMVCRGGGVWISKDGIAPYHQVTEKRVYPPVEGEFEDPVVWKDSIQYHLIVNDWYGRIAWYLRSKDGVNWVVDPGVAYEPGVAVHANGKKEDWYKYERIKILQDKYGRAIQANFAVIDTLKLEDLPNDNHSSKNISLPLNPGVLLSLESKEEITPETKEIDLRIISEAGFNPIKEVDLKSLRFGASSEVNYGRGCKAIKSRKEGNDLIVTFDAQGNGITKKEFAPKLIGKTKKGKLLYGYARLPWINYIVPILSAEKPRIFKRSRSEFFRIPVTNYGQISSKQSFLEIKYKEGEEEKSLGKIKLPEISAYVKKEIDFTFDFHSKRNKEYNFEIIISTENEESSSFHFNMKMK